MKSSDIVPTRSRHRGLIAAVSILLWQLSELHGFFGCGASGSSRRAQATRDWVVHDLLVNAENQIHGIHKGLRSFFAAHFIPDMLCQTLNKNKAVGIAPLGQLCGKVLNSEAN